MKVSVNFLPKSQAEIMVEISLEEFKPYIERGVEIISKEIKIEGFRPGKVPYEILKSKIGEMAILEEAARIAVNKTADKVIIENLEKKEIVGRPEINITKLAPNNPLEYKMIVAVLPEVTLPDLKSAPIKLEKTTINEEEFKKVLNYLQESRVKESIVDREAKEGDKVVVDVEIFLDKVPIEGGLGKNVAVIIGKEFLIPGFDKHLIGLKKGEMRELTLRYPDKHYMKNLAGKIAEFRVKTIEIYNREIPDLDDSFAVGFGMKNVQEFKDSVRKNLEEEKRAKENQKAEIAMLEKLVQSTKFGDIPELLINHEVDSMLYELEHDIEHRGGKFSDYLQSIGKTRDQLTLDILPEAIKRVKTAIFIREVAIKESVTVNDQEIDDKIKELLKQYQGYEKVEERVKSSEYQHYLKNTILNRKVIDKLKEWNIS